MHTTESPPPLPAAGRQRLFFLDWLRIAAFGLLIFYHVGMYYVSWDWHVKSPAAGHTLEPLMLLSSPWRLALLFLVSGVASASMWARDNGRGFLAGRSWRLLPPLLFGMLVVVPPQSYFEVVQKVAYAGSYADFMGLYLAGYHGFCRGQDCLALPTWNHLWFVVYLWAYTVLLWALLRLRPAALDTLARPLSRALRGPGLILWPVVLLTVVRVALVQRFPATHALVNDWFNHAMYFSMFLAGAAFSHWPEVWDAMRRVRWLALGLALAGWFFLVLYYGVYSGEPVPPEWLRQLQRGIYAGVQWCAIVAAVGFARQHWSADHRWRHYLSEAVFPVYILHQTLIVLLAMALRPLQWAPVWEGPVLVLATLLLSFAGYEGVRRVALLRPLFGLRTVRQRHGLDAGPAVLTGRL